VIKQLKAGKSIEAIAAALNMKTHQVMGEWVSFIWQPKHCSGC